MELQQRKRGHSENVTRLQVSSLSGLSDSFTVADRGSYAGAGLLGLWRLRSQSLLTDAHNFAKGMASLCWV